MLPWDVDALGNSDYFYISRSRILDSDITIVIITTSLSFSLSHLLHTLIFAADVYTTAFL